MKWTVTIKPINVLLNAWLWLAVREDQESVLNGDQSFATLAGARADAQEKIQAYEDNVMVVRNATVTEEFLPEGVEETPAEEPPVEEPA